MTPRSDPHTEAIRDFLEGHKMNFVPSGQAHERRAAALAALAALESERDEAVALRDFAAALGLDANTREGIAVGRAVAAEARVTQLADLLRRLRGWDTMDVAADGPYWRREIDSALGVVADGGGGRTGDLVRSATERRGGDPSKVGGGDASIRAVTSSRSEETR